MKVRVKVNGNYEEGIKLLKYKDEEELEALRDEVKALRRLAKAPEGKSRLSASAKGGAGLRVGVGANQASAVMLEDLYRRARTEVAAEAGAGYGRVSLEALYLLPAEFTNAYQRLFLQALRESPGQMGEANPPTRPSPKLLRRGEPNQKVVVKDEETGEVVGERMAEVLDRDPDRGGGKARSNGRRHRDHWTIRDERAFRLKERIDGELRDLAAVALRELGQRTSPTSSRAAGKSSRLNSADADGATTGNQANGTVAGTPTCPGCRKFLKASWRYCPHCGTGAVEGR